MVEQQQADLLDDLLAPIPRKAILPAVEAALGVSRKQAEAIVQAFDDYVARPLEEKTCRAFMSTSFWRLNCPARCLPKTVSGPFQTSNSGGFGAAETGRA